MTALGVAATFSDARGAVPAESPLRKAPRLVAVDEKALPKAEKIGTPEVRTLLGYTRRVLHLPDGRTLAIFSFSGSAPANWLFLIDSRDLSVERFDVPNNDIATGRWELVKQIAPNTKYTRGFSESPEGRIHFRATGPDLVHFVFDPDTRKVTARLVLWPKSDVTSVRGVSSNGILVASSGDQIALVDTTTREILYRGSFPLPVGSRIRRGRDGGSYFLAAGKLHRWRFVRNEIIPLALAPGRFLTEADANLWLTADSTSIYRLRLP